MNPALADLRGKQRTEAVPPLPHGLEGTLRCQQVAAGTYRDCRSPTTGRADLLQREAQQEGCPHAGRAIRIPARLQRAPRHLGMDCGGSTCRGSPMTMIFCCCRPRRGAPRTRAGVSVLRIATLRQAIGPWPEACLRPWQHFVAWTAAGHPKGRSEAEEPCSGLTRCPPCDTQPGISRTGDQSPSNNAIAAPSITVTTLTRSWNSRSGSTRADGAYRAPGRRARPGPQADGMENTA